MSDNPHELANEIHFNTGVTGFASRITGLANDFPTGDPANIHMYDRLLREYFRNCNNLGTGTVTSFTMEGIDEPFMNGIYNHSGTLNGKKRWIGRNQAGQVDTDIDIAWNSGNNRWEIRYVTESYFSNSSPTTYPWDVEGRWIEDGGMRSFPGPQFSQFDGETALTDSFDAGFTPQTISGFFDTGLNSAL